MAGPRRAVTPRPLVAAFAALLVASLLATQPAAAQDSPPPAEPPTATIDPAAPLAHATTYDIRVAALNHDTPSTYTTTSATTPPAPPN